MEVRYGKKFLKQLASVPSETRVKIEEFVFNEMTSVPSIFNLGKVEKMQGYHSFYKVRFGNYRLGLAIENDVIIVKTVMHRKEIYKFFP